MASDRRFYEIDVTVLYKGASCKDLDVKFEKPTECANIRCEYSNGSILVEIPKDCKECVYAIVTCNDDDCEVCTEPQRVSICPCDGPEDCPNCQTCVDQRCVSVCKESEFCNSEGRCVECDEDNPCPENQVCVSGKCQCPTDKPILNDKGVCVSCDEANPCPPCTYCTPEGCKPVVCPTGVCNPKTGKCVQCNGSGDCKEANECCKDNNCVCCEGFRRDFTTGKCVPVDECPNGDSDCGDCEICYLGKCIPKECPPGYICVKGDCKKECNCADSTCSKSEACVSADANKCYCHKCEGTCSEDNDCGPHCICDGNGNCVPNPCKGSCTNGNECGPGCGCDKNGDCVPCSSKKCVSGECEKVLGCGCVNGNDCGKIGGCSGNCSSYHDCPPNCTCVGGKCVPCAAYSCTTGDCSKQPGCACKSDNTCGGDPNRDTCDDSFTVEKVDETCDLIARLEKEFGCSCSDLTINNKLSSVSANGEDYLLNLLVELRKGSVSTVSAVNTLPLLGDTTNANIAENEKPSSGVVEVLVTITYREVNEDGIFLGLTTGPVQSYSATMINKDSHTFQNVVIPSIGKKVSDFLTVHKVDVEIRQSTNLVFPNNCSYAGPKEVNSFSVVRNDDFEDIIGGNALKKINFAGFTTINSLSDRNPMLIWYRSDDGTYGSSNIFRKIYVPKGTDDKYVDTLYGLAEIPDGKYPLVDPEGELWSGKYFSAKVDCGCDKDADLGKLVFCNPDELNFELQECNKVIKLLSPFSPCDVNQDITQWETANYDIPNSAQTKYLLYLNGTHVQTFVHKKGLGMVKDGTSDSMFGKITFTEPITEIKLTINHDDTNECTLIYPVTPVDNIEVTKTVNCDISGANYQVTIPKTGGDYTINSITLSQGSLVQGTNNFILTLPKATTVVATYNFSNGCSMTDTFNEDCCDEFSVELSSNSPSCGGNLILQHVVSGGDGPFTATFTYPDGTKNTTTNNSVTITNPQTGTYSVKVVDSNGCEANSSKNVTIFNKPTFLFSGYKNICAGDSTKIDVEVNADGVGGVVYYTANGNPTSVTVPASGKFSIGPINTAATYVFDKIEVQGCEFPIGQVIEIKILDEVAITTSVNPVSKIACSGSDVTFSLSGGLQGDSVDLVVGGVVVKTTVFDALGNASLTVKPTSTTVYTLKTNSTASCLTGLPKTETISVVAGPTITLDSTSCDATLTNRTMTFNNIDSATDQNDNALTVTGNSVVVNPNIVSAVKAKYDNGTCEVTEVFAVDKCACPSVTITLADRVINLGDSTTLTPVVSGGSGSYSYAWSTGATTPSITVSPTTTTSYTVTVTDEVNGCIYQKIVTVIVVDCDGGLGSLTFKSCSCDGPSCIFTFTPAFSQDYTGCKINEALSDVQAFIDGSGTGVSVDIADGSKLDFLLGITATSGCPDPTTIKFAGTIVFLDETGNSCCDGTSIEIDITKSRPAGGWGCIGC